MKKYELYFDIVETRKLVFELEEDDWQSKIVHEFEKLTKEEVVKRSIIVDETDPVLTQVGSNYAP